MGSSSVQEIQWCSKWLLKRVGTLTRDVFRIESGQVRALRNRDFGFLTVVHFEEIYNLLDHRVLMELDESFIFFDAYCKKLTDLRSVTDSELQY